MALPIATVINSIIHEKRDVCCLCLTSVEDNPYHFTDTIVADMTNEDCDRNVEYILNSLFDEEICHYVATWDILCQNCVMLAYTFIKFKEACKINTECITNVLTAFSKTFERTPNVPINSKSLYTSFNTEDLSSKQYYDFKYIPPTNSLALKRLRELNEPNPHMEMVICGNDPHMEMEEVEEIEVGTSEETFYNKDIKHDQLPHQIICQDCGRVFKLKSSLIRHKKQYSCPFAKARPLQGNYKCHYCDKRYYYRMGLIVHLRLHENGKTYDCEYCDKKCATQRALIYHLVKHTCVKIKCPHCQKHFPSTKLLEEHKLEDHPHMECGTCGKTFYNKDRLMKHEKSHYDQIICPECGQAFKLESSLKRHIRQNKCSFNVPGTSKTFQRDYKCHYCLKKYVHKMGLIVHLRLHGEGKKTYDCEYCDKKFPYQSALTYHLVKHTRKRDFLCTICGGKFVTWESLLYHSRLHTGEKPYKCPQCDLSFLSASRRSTHVKRVHSEPVQSSSEFEN